MEELDIENDIKTETPRLKLTDVTKIEYGISVNGTDDTISMIVSIFQDMYISVSFVIPQVDEYELRNVYSLEDWIVASNEVWTIGQTKITLGHIAPLNPGKFITSDNWEKIKKSQQWFDFVIFCIESVFWSASVSKWTIANKVNDSEQVNMSWVQRNPITYTDRTVNDTGSATTYDNYIKSGFDSKPTKWNERDTFVPAWKTRTVQKNASLYARYDDHRS